MRTKISFCLIAGIIGALAVNEVFASKFWPMLVGQQYTYTRFDPCDKEWAVELKVTGQSVIGSKDYFHLIKYNYDNDSRWRNAGYIRSTNNEVYAYNPNGDEFLEFQKGPVGTKWTLYQPDGKYNYKVVEIVSIGPVTVPYGTFDQAYKFRKYQCVDPNNLSLGQSPDWYEWIVPGIGFVKDEDYYVDGPTPVIQELTEMVELDRNTITKCKVEAHNGISRDIISFSGAMPDVLPSDLHKAEEIKVVIDSEYLSAPLEWVFAINDIYKGQYVRLINNKKIIVNNRSIVSGSKFQFNTKDGKMFFTARNVDLTGLSCPITVTITIGDRIAQIEVGEDVVNGLPQTCPLQLLMGVADTVTVAKSKVGFNRKLGTDLMRVDGFFTIAGEPNKIDPNKPLAVKIGTQTFTIGGSAFISNLRGDVKICSKAVCIENINWLCTARLDFAKCTFTITLSNITIDRNGVVPFGVNVFGFDLGGPGSDAKVNTGY